VDFLPHLTELKKRGRVIKYEDLVEEFHRSLPLASEEDAKKIIGAMSMSGLVIESGDIIYLHPEEIAKTLRPVLPIDVPVMKERLAAVKKVLQPMEELKKRIESRARRKSTLVNVSFLGVMAAQWGIFFRLCYWELSWDVIEPLGFFASGLTTILSFGWFIATRRNFSFEGMNSQVMSNWVRKKLVQADFDFLEYERLRNERQRLEESLRLAGCVGENVE